jgi:hypothetical protein
VTIHSRAEYIILVLPNLHLVQNINYLKLIILVKSTRSTISRVYWISLYMFRTVPPSIIRSPRLYTQHQVYVIQVSWPLSNKQSTNLYDIYLMLYVQYLTPDDGRRYRPKHVEWYSVNSRNFASSLLYYRNISRCMVPWMSDLFYVTFFVVFFRHHCFLPEPVWHIIHINVQFLFYVERAKDEAKIFNAIINR